MQNELTKEQLQQLIDFASAIVRLTELEDWKVFENLILEKASASMPKNVALTDSNAALQAASQAVYANGLKMAIALAQRQKKDLAGYYEALHRLDSADASDNDPLS